MDKCLEAFSEDVIYTPADIGISPVTMLAIFDREFISVDPQTGASVISTQPTIGVKNNQLPSAPNPGDRVTIRGELYRVIESQTDGWAGTKILLHKI